jgi:hypothetical protein
MRWHVRILFVGERYLTCIELRGLSILILHCTSLQSIFRLTLAIFKLILLLGPSWPLLLERIVSDLEDLIAYDVC